MTDFYVGQIVFSAGTVVPNGLLLCDGKILNISQYRALYALLGTRYGGDGKATFALPNLQGRSPIGWGTSSASNITYSAGDKGGSETVTLAQTDVPSHTHTLAGSTKAGTVGYTGNLISSAGQSGTNPTYNIFADGSDSSKQVSLATDSVTTVGGSGAHSNMQPYLTLNAFIVVAGIFPRHAD